MVSVNGGMMRQYELWDVIISFPVMKDGSAAGGNKGSTEAPFLSNNRIQTALIVAATPLGHFTQSGTIQRLFNCTWTVKKNS